MAYISYVYRISLRFASLIFSANSDSHASNAFLPDN